MKSFKKRGQTGITNFFVVLVVGAILALIGVLIFSKVDSSIDKDSFTAEQNATVLVIENTVLDAFELGVIAFIVLAAAIILSAVFLFARHGQG